MIVPIHRTANRHRLLDLPELNLAIFAFQLNFVWEFWQTPFYQGMPTAPHWQAVKVCTVAAMGDAALMLLAFWAVSALAGSREWILAPTTPQVLAFVAVGIALTVVGEWLGTEVLRRWQYATSMPQIPLLGTGVVPLLQWAILPPIVIWLVHRQLT